MLCAMLTSLKCETREPQRERLTLNPSRVDLTPRASEHPQPTLILHPSVRQLPSRRKNIQLCVHKVLRRVDRARLEG